MSHRQYWSDFWGSIDLNGPITILMRIWLHHWRPVHAHFLGCDLWDFLGGRWSCHLLTQWRTRRYVCSYFVESLCLCEANWFRFHHSLSHCYLSYIRCTMWLIITVIDCWITDSWSCPPWRTTSYSWWSSSFKRHPPSPGKYLSSIYSFVLKSCIASLNQKVARSMSFN